MHTLWRSVPTTAVAILAIAASARAAGPDPIGPPSQSLADGCQRNIPGFLTFTSPEWVYVHSYDSQFQAPDQTRVAEGVARDSHPAEDDLPQGHKAFDLNFNLAVDGQYHDLIGTCTQQDVELDRLRSRQADRQLRPGT